MIVDLRETRMMPTYLVAGATTHAAWAPNAAGFGALGIFRERIPFSLELTTRLEFGVER